MSATSCSFKTAWNIEQYLKNKTGEGRIKKNILELLGNPPYKN